MTDGDKGLYSKYIVTKADGTPLDGDCFVLRPDRDPAARCALKEYAYQTPNGELAADIEDWLDRIGEIDYTTRDAERMMDTGDRQEIAALRAENERFKAALSQMIVTVEVEADFHDTTGFVMTRDNLRGLAQAAHAALEKDARKDPAPGYHPCQRCGSQAPCPNGCERQKEYDARAAGREGVEHGM